MLACHMTGSYEDGVGFRLTRLVDLRSIEQ